MHIWIGSVTTGQACVILFFVLGLCDYFSSYQSFINEKEGIITISFLCGTALHDGHVSIILYLRLILC